MENAKSALWQDRLGKALVKAYQEVWSDLKLFSVLVLCSFLIDEKNQTATSINKHRKTEKLTKTVQNPLKKIYIWANPTQGRPRISGPSQFQASVSFAEGAVGTTYPAQMNQNS